MQRMSDDRIAKQVLVLHASRGKNEGGHVLFGNMIIKYTEKGGLSWEEA